jgi:hypothetical protein
MDVVNRRPVCLPDRFDLTRYPNGIDHEQASGYCAGLRTFDYSNKTFTYPCTVVGAIQLFSCSLKGAALVLHPWRPLLDEIAGSDYLRAISFPQQVGNSRFASANWSG